MLANLSECSHSFLDLSSGVGSRKLGSDPGLVFRHNWVAEANDKDVVLHQLFGHSGSFLCIADHNWSNGAIIMTINLEACRLQSLSKVRSVGGQLVNKICRFLQHLENLN